MNDRKKEGNYVVAIVNGMILLQARKISFLRYHSEEQTFRVFCLTKIIYSLFSKRKFKYFNNFIAFFFKIRKKVVMKLFIKYTHTQTDVCLWMIKNVKIMTKFICYISSTSHVYKGDAYKENLKNLNHSK